MIRIFLAAAAGLMALGLQPALADSAGASFSTGSKFTQKTGAEIYGAVCQACHMDKGQGAVGAGKYPALAKNENLTDPSYPIFIVLHGQKGMPPFGDMLDDDQVAAVVDYVRTSFGNNYTDPKTSAEDVKGAR